MHLIFQGIKIKIKLQSDLAKIKKIFIQKKCEIAFYCYRLFIDTKQIKN